MVRPQTWPQCVQTGQSPILQAMPYGWFWPESIPGSIYQRKKFFEKYGHCSLNPWRPHESWLQRFHTALGYAGAVVRGSSSAVPSFVLGTLSKTFCLSVPQHSHLQRMDNYDHSLGLSSEWSVSECSKCLGLPLMWWAHTWIATRREGKLLRIISCCEEDSVTAGTNSGMKFQSVLCSC